jgi:hypothetical protein
LQSRDLNSIRQSNQATPGDQPGVMLTQPAPRPENAGGVSALFSQGLVEWERQVQSELEMSAMNYHYLREIQADRQREPQRLYPGLAVKPEITTYYLGADGQAACMKNPVSGQVRCEGKLAQ